MGCIKAEGEYPRPMGDVQLFKKGWSEIQPHLEGHERLTFWLSKEGEVTTWHKIIASYLDLNPEVTRFAEFTKILQAPRSED
jgi:hypothetical protein